MAPIQAKFIAVAYEALCSAGNSASAIKKALKGASVVIDGGVTAAIETFLENIVEWFMGKIIGGFKDSVLLACLIRVEYAIREGKMQITRALFLKNKCSQCGCLGHNAQNHNESLAQYLRGKGLLDDTNDALDAMEGSSFEA